MDWHILGDGEMGCLLELLGDLLMDIYIEGMCRILPEQKPCGHIRFVLELMTAIFSILLLIAIFVGLIFMMNEEELPRRIGRYPVCVPLGVIIVQIALEAIVRLLSKKR